jgi:putative PIN family toxin of toxin-antitoxin system
MRIVLDNNVLVRAAASPTGPAGSLLPLIVPPHLLLFSSDSFRELSEVLHYDHVRKLHGLSDEEVGDFLHAIQGAALIVQLPAGPPPRVVPADEDDDYVVATAVHAKADVLCTRDRDLFHADALAYCDAHGIEVMDDVALLHRLRAVAQSD